MVTAKQKAARAKFAYVMKHGGFRKRKRADKITRAYHRAFSPGGYKTRHKKVYSMGRKKKYGKRSGGFGVGKVLSTKNVLYTLAGAYIAPKVLGVDSRIGAAAGSYLGGGGIAGAAAGYFVAPMVMGAIGGATGNNW